MIGSLAFNIHSREMGNGVELSNYYCELDSV